MSVSITERDYVDRFTAIQRSFIIAVCSMNMDLALLHSLNDCHAILAIGQCSIIRDLFQHSSNDVINDPKYFDTVLRQYMTEYCTLMNENQIIDAIDIDLVQQELDELNMAVSIIDVIDQTETTRLRQLADSYN